MNIKYYIRKYIYKKNYYYNLFSAYTHNALYNVNNLNSSYEYWKNCLEKDKIFINNIYYDLIKLCKIDKAFSIADYGCGTGVLVNKLKSNYPDKDINGFDFSKEKINNCKMHYKNISDSFKVLDVYENNANIYDVIIATEVLEHLLYPKKALINLISSLNPSGGRIFLTVPDGREDSFTGHIHFWSPESWKLFIEDVIDNSMKYKIGKMKNKNYALIILNKTNQI